MNEDITKKHNEFREMLKTLFEIRCKSTDLLNDNRDDDVDYYYTIFEQYVGMCSKSILDDLLQIKWGHTSLENRNPKRHELNMAILSKLGLVHHQMTTEMMRNNENIEDEHNE